MLLENRGYRISNFTAASERHLKCTLHAKAFPSFCTLRYRMTHELPVNRLKATICRGNVTENSLNERWQWYEVECSGHLVSSVRDDWLEFSRNCKIMSCAKDPCQAVPCMVQQQIDPDWSQLFAR